MVVVDSAGIRLVPNGMIVGSMFAGDGVGSEVGVVVEPAIVLVVVEGADEPEVCRQRSTAATAAAAARTSNGS